MKFSTCNREPEVLQLLESGGWPRAAAPELAAHVQSCRSCGEMALVRAALRTEKARTAGVARLVSPGLLWWRAQLRRRNTAIACINRPLVGAQLFALALNVAVVVALAVWQARQGLRWLDWAASMAESLRQDSFWEAALPAAGMSLWVVVPALATVALLAGVAVYLVAEKR